MDTPICPLCGQPITSGGVYLNEYPYLFLCNDCGVRFWTCISCKHGKTCALQENPHNLPPVVLKTFQQGNMVIQQQVINPDLVNETCRAGCRCWNEETHTCLKMALHACELHELAPIFDE